MFGCKVCLPCDKMSRLLKRLQLRNIIVPQCIASLLFVSHTIAILHTIPNTGRNAITLRQSGSCYYPTGDPSPGDSPCGSGDATPCCPYQWQCEKNGLCYLENEGYYGRYTCTDQTWSSDNCPQFCTYGTENPFLSLKRYLKS